MSLTVDEYYKVISSEKANSDEAVTAMAPGEVSHLSTIMHIDETNTVSESLTAAKPRLRAPHGRITP
jgi:hypothetical protein